VQANQTTSKQHESHPNDQAKQLNQIHKIPQARPSTREGSFSQHRQNIDVFSNQCSPFPLTSALAMVLKFKFLGKKRISQKNCS
jgi:hypothetical protein